MKGFVFERVKIIGGLYFYVRFDTTDLMLWPVFLLSRKALFFNGFGLVVDVEPAKKRPA